MADSDTFTAGEQVVYGPMSEKPSYLLAWSQETTACNGPEDTRPKHRRGAIRIEVENGETVTTDCDNVTPFPRIREDAKTLRRILKSATPRLQRALRQENPTSTDEIVRRLKF